MHPKRKVLVVDDNEINAKMLEEFLTGKDYDVQLAFTGQDGLLSVANTNPDIIILDLFLPDMKGSQVCVQLRARKATQHIPIILCTAHTISQDEKMQGFQSGVDDYLIRPFELAELAVRMEALLRRATPHFNNEVLAGIDALLKIPHTPKPAPLPISATPPALATVERVTKAAVAAVAAQTATKVTPAIVQPETFHPLRRILLTLNTPSAAFVQSNQNEDLLVSLVLVLGTPMIASLIQVNDVGTVAWAGSLLLRIAAHIGAWFAIGGVLHLAVPFVGRRWSMKRALSVAGLSWAPKTLEAAAAVAYAVIAPLFVAKTAQFSGGLDLIPGFQNRPMGPLLSQINLFSMWSVALLLIAIWTLCSVKKKWTSITVTIALIALFCQMVARV